MRSPIIWKICKGALAVSVLAWLSLGTAFDAGWWGPTPCWGQAALETAPTPETIVVGSFSENRVTGCSIIQGNTLTETGGTNTTEIINSFQCFRGVCQVNMAAGALNNQMNVTAIAGSGGELKVNSLSYKTRIQDNNLTISGNKYTANISGSAFEGGAGIAQVNQAAGNLNAQVNGFSLNIGAAGSNGAIALTDAQLSAANPNNTITNPDPTKPNSYSAKLDTQAPASKFTGLWSSNQVAGNTDQVTMVFNVNVHIVPSTP
jgi:hypothetical protein